MSKHQVNPVRVYSLTINSSSRTENLLLSTKDLEIILKKECKAYVFALEQGAQGRHHYQCIVHLMERTRNPHRCFLKHVPSGIELWEFSPCSNVKALQNYVAKSPLGEVSRFSQQALALPIFDHIELRHAQLAMLEIIQKESDDRSIFVFSSQGGLRQNHIH